MNLNHKRNYTQKNLIPMKQHKQLQGGIIMFSIHKLNMNQISSQTLPLQFFKTNNASCAFQQQATHALVLLYIHYSLELHFFAKQPSKSAQVDPTPTYESLIALPRNLNTLPNLYNPSKHLSSFFLKSSLFHQT